MWITDVVFIIISIFFKYLLLLGMSICEKQKDIKGYQLIPTRIHINPQK